jgi:hypothetical protein
MLEKIAGIALVNKLRAILLMEADFNMHNRIIFGNRMIQRAREEGLIPPEIFSTEGTTAEDGCFGKGLVCDISRQSRTNMVITSNDAASCYDRIAHAMLSLILQAMTVWKGAITAMLIPIQIMCFFLRTGFGESASAKGTQRLQQAGKYSALRCYAATNAVATARFWSARCLFPAQN